MPSRYADHVLTGTFAARPAATAVPAGTLYASSTDGVVYQSNGTAWSTWLAAPAAGATVLISDALLGADAASFDLTSIPGTYKQLMLIGYLRTVTAAASAQMSLRLNGLSTAIYTDQAFRATGTTVTAFDDIAATSAAIGRAPAATATALRFGTLTMVFPNYANATNHKSWTFDTFTPVVGANTNFVERGGGVAALTAAITQITLTSNANWLAGSRVSLYGMN